MKILFCVEFYYPSIGGAQEVVRQIAERMASYGHEVSVATTRIASRKSLSHNGVTLVEFSVWGNNVRGLHPGRRAGLWRSNRQHVDSWDRLR